MRFLLHSDLISEDAVLQRIKFLQDEIKKNPTYVDLYGELARCQLEHARIAWGKGLESYRKSLEMNPSLSEINQLLEGVEHEYENIKQVLNRITDKI